MPRGISIANVIEERNNLLEEYKSLEKENKSLRNKLYKPEQTVVVNRGYETKQNASSWTNGFITGFWVSLIGTYLGMIFSHYYY
tara:strand:+ start:1532 stop:1783 length:252 start_codon:yes stop_codon:yes gene_type:complete